VSQKDFVTVPKVELHCHIEGTLTPELVRKLLKKYGCNTAVKNMPWLHSADFRWDPMQWLNTMQTITNHCLRSVEDYKEAFDSYLDSLAIHGAIYAEPSLALDRCQMNGMNPEEILAIAGAALQEAYEKYDLEVRLLIALDYRMSVDDCYLMIELGKKIIPQYFVGIDLQGKPVFARSKFSEVFDFARKQGLGTRAHVGEFEGANSVWEAIDQLGVDRIAHGVRAIEDDMLMSRLARDQIPLDLSLGSNVALGVVSSWQKHPINQFIELGIPVSISTDDPLFFSPSIAFEYEKVAKTFHWGREDLMSISRQSLESGFMPINIKAKLRQFAGACGSIRLKNEKEHSNIRSQ
jgi:adenosine deaminase